MTFESVEVPFVRHGNRRALTGLQLESDPYLKDFFNRFRHCFELPDDPNLDIWLFIEPEDIPGEDVPPLGTFDKDEWREVTKLVRPDLTDEEYDVMWAEFCEMKAKQEVQ